MYQNIEKQHTIGEGVGIIDTLDLHVYVNLSHNSTSKILWFNKEHHSLVLLSDMTQPWNYTYDFTINM